MGGNRGRLFAIAMSNAKKASQTKLRKVYFPKIQLRSFFIGRMPATEKMRSILEVSTAKKGEKPEQENKMQAILLAGGLGTRLRSVVSDRPKPMALIEDKPFMEYVTRELVRSGITEIIFAVGYKGFHGGRIF